MNEQTILLTESVIDIFRKRNAGQQVSQEEVEQVVTRFRQLVNAQI